jgi:hypothetical protein
MTQRKLDDAVCGPMQTLWLPRGLYLEFFGEKPWVKSFYARVCINQGKIADNDRIHWIVRSLAASKDELQLRQEENYITEIKLNEIVGKKGKIGGLFRSPNFDQVKLLNAVENFDLICRACDVLDAVIEHFNIAVPKSDSQNLEPVEAFQDAWTDPSKWPWPQSIAFKSNWAPHVKEFFQVAESHFVGSKNPVFAEVSRELGHCEFICFLLNKWNKKHEKTGVSWGVETIVFPSIRNGRKWWREARKSKVVGGVSYSPSWAGYVRDPKKKEHKKRALPKEEFRKLAHALELNVNQEQFSLEDELAGLDDLLSVNPEAIEKKSLQRLERFFHPTGETNQKLGHKAKYCLASRWKARVTISSATSNLCIAHRDLIVNLATMRAFDESIVKFVDVEARPHEIEEIGEKSALAHSNDDSILVTRHRWDKKCLDVLSIKEHANNTALAIAQDEVATFQDHQPSPQGRYNDREEIKFIAEKARDNQIISEDEHNAFVAYVDNLNEDPNAIKCEAVDSALKKMARARNKLGSN